MSFQYGATLAYYIVKNLVALDCELNYVKIKIEPKIESK
jgi:hypothetical protein